MKQLIVALGVWFALGGAALAQQSGTPEDQRACSPSVKRFCLRAIPGGEFAVLACLQQNRARIALSCRQVLINYGQ